MWLTLLGVAKWLFGNVLEFLNKRVESAERVQINRQDNTAAVIGTVVAGISNADNLNTQVRLKEGPWSPWVVVTIFGFMVPFAIHTWQVVIDSSKWLIALGPYYVPYIYQARAHVEALAGPGSVWETTEQAVIQSLFVGAGAAVGAIPIITALRKSWR